VGYCESPGELPLCSLPLLVTAVSAQTDRPEPSAEESRQNEILEEDLNILRYLDEGGFSDETEVIWSDLDKLLGLARNNSGPNLRPAPSLVLTFSVSAQAYAGS
jgi:hypothetical protein